MGGSNAYWLSSNFVLALNAPKSDTDQMRIGAFGSNPSGQFVPPILNKIDFASIDYVRLKFLRNFFFFILSKKLFLPHFRCQRKTFRFRPIAIGFRSSVRWAYRPKSVWKWCKQWHNAGRDLRNSQKTFSKIIPTHYSYITKLQTASRPQHTLLKILKII